MIYKLKKSQKDEYTLNQLVDESKQVSIDQPEDYKNKVVLKPWGYEFLMYENEDVAIWYLYIKNNHSTSMHCHPKKMTSLTLLSGEALCSGFSGRHEIKNFDSVLIDKGAFHTTKATSEEGIHLIELETPPNKTDLIRMKDSYGRKNKGYEGLSEMRPTDLENYDYFFFNEKDIENPNVKIFKNYKLKLNYFKNYDDLLENFQVNQESVYKICKGNFEISNEKILLGNLVSGAELLDFEKIHFSDELILLELCQGNYL